MKSRREALSAAQATPGVTPREADHPPVELPITGELDLHTFAPRDLGELLPAYLAACQARGIYTVRIIHGKGSGTLRATVLAFLQHSPLVISYRQGDETSGGWGATIATLQQNPVVSTGGAPAAGN